MSSARQAEQCRYPLAPSVEEEPGLSGLRVLVVGINYAPEHTGIAPYTTHACEFLAQAGADVLVLAGVPHYPHWTVPAAYRGRLRTHEQHGRVRVRRLRHTVPTRQSAMTRSMYEATFGLHVAAQVLPWQPDVVLTVVPSLLGSVAASLIARRTGAPLVVWVQDLMGAAAAQSGITGGSKIARLTVALEGWAVRRAASVLVVSEAFGRHLHAAGVAEHRVHLVPNWSHGRPPPRDRAEVRRRLGWGERELIALHSGNMGLKQGLENIIAAAQLTSAGRSRVRFVLMGDGSQRMRLEELGAGVDGLQMLPPVSADEFPGVLAAADMLLVNERATAVDMSLPSKLTSYFKAGVPVVAAVPPDGGTAREVERSRGGVVVAPEDPAALLEAVEALGEDAPQRARLGQAGEQHARENLDPADSLGRLGALVAAAAATRRRGVGQRR